MMRLIRGIVRSVAPARLLATRGCDKKTIYMTFDDGPHPELTPRLLDVFKRQGVKATFFFVGSAVEEHPEIAMRSLKDGHEIGSHSYSHRKERLEGLKGFREEYLKTAAVFKNVLGVEPRIYRPPYGRLTPGLLLYAAVSGVTIVHWSAVSGDDGAERGKVLANLDRVAGGDIVLFHDDSHETAEVIEGWIAQKKALGYRFGTIGELLG